MNDFMTADDAERMMLKIWIESVLCIPSVLYDTRRGFRIVRVWKRRKFVYHAPLIVKLKSAVA